jgi:hypothetical protein
MLAKSLLLGAVLASTPLCFVAATATPQEGRPDQSGTQAPATPDLTMELQRLRQELAAATGEARALRQELEAALDALDAAHAPRRQRNCTPSRSQLTHYQWLHERGHGARAQRVLERITQEHGANADRLNALAWELMNDKESAGKFDAAALALSKRMLALGTTRHHHLDTAALASFLNGAAADAVQLQEQALAQCQGNDEYRRRLLTYAAAVRSARADVAVASKPAF